MSKNNTLDLKAVTVKERIRHFSFAEMVANNDGKTSSSGVMGCLVITVSCLSFLFGSYEFHISGKADVMIYASANILVGAGLLGYRKSKTEKSGSVTDEVKNEIN